jgi:histidine phosphotransfer protein HptB
MGSPEPPLQIVNQGAAPYTRVLCRLGISMLINHERLVALKSEVGEDGFDEVVSLFFEESDEVLTRLLQPGMMDHAPDIHFLRGSALTLGLDDLADWCARFEQLVLMPQDLADLASLYQRSKQAFEQEVAAAIAA